MRLLLDNDIFCKLGCCDLLQDAVEILGLEFSRCCRLSSLPHMLCRGRIRKRYGDEHCEQLISLTEKIPALGNINRVWLEKMSNIHEIDPGEAQIFAAAVDEDVLIMSGDKRALRAIKEIPDIVTQLKERVIIMEAVLIALCRHLTEEYVKEQIDKVSGFDKMINICFSSANPHPMKALYSYYNDSAYQLAPLILWNPDDGGGK